MIKQQITYKNVSDLIPYARNSRTHSDEQVLQIAASIKEFGFTNPILIDGENGIIAGHGRVLAAMKLSINEVPCIELSGMTDTQKRAYIIADNKLALNADWDINLLKVEFEDLDKDGFDISLLGFDDDELSGIFDETKNISISDLDSIENNTNIKLMIEFRESDSVEIINHLSSIIDEFVDAKMTVINE